MSLRPFAAIVLAGFFLATSAAEADVLQVSTLGSDDNPCTTLAPCASIGRAYAAAAPGEVVEVQAGRYGNQRVEGDEAKDGNVPEVLIRPALGAEVAIDDLSTRASNVRYSGFTVDGSQGGQPDIRGGHDVVLENLRATNFYVKGPVRGISVLGGDYGPYVSCGGGAQITADHNDEADPTLMPTDILIDGVTFHDYSIGENCPDAHLDCLHVFASVHVVVRNSTFRNCQHYGYLLNSNGAGNRDGHVVENNTFGTALVAGFALRGGDLEDFDDLVVRYNSGDFITPQVNNVLRDVHWVGNAATDLGPCRPEVDSRNNVSPRSKCGPKDIEASPGFVNVVADDFRLTIGAAAIDQGDPSDFPAGDHDLRARPAGAAPDAGALEDGATAPAPPLPRVRLLDGPAPRVDAEEATFMFSVADERLALLCDLDGLGWIPCESGVTYRDLADGPHEFQVRAVDGTVIGDPQTHNWIVDVSVPVMTIVDGPAEGSTVPAASFLFKLEASEPVEMLCALDDADWWPCVEGERGTSLVKVYRSISDGPHTFRVKATDGPHESEVVSRHFSVKALPIDTMITAGPAEDELAAPNVSFAFTATELDTTFECRLDGGDWEACPSPQAYARLTDGPHIFAVRGTDVSGNVDNTPAERRFVVDAHPADTAIVSGPEEGAVTGADVAFEFTGSEPSVTFECALSSPGGDNWHACTSPASYKDLSAGSYTFAVRAVDRAGNVDDTPAQRRFTVDRSPVVDTTITGGTPDGAFTTGAAAYSFASVPVGALFECMLAGPSSFSWLACSDPMSLSGLPDGGYMFSVRAINAFGQPDATPSSRSFTVDQIEPDTTIADGPAAGSTSGPEVSFAFGASEPGTTFDCKLDALPFVACASPVGYTGLAPGSHTFQVRAIDRAGNVDLFPARRTWNVEAATVVLDTMIGGGPPDGATVREVGVTFDLTANKAPSTFECSLDGEPFAPCQSPYIRGGIADGLHTLRVRAKDETGAVDTSPAERTWTIDSTPPATTLAGTPAEGSTVRDTDASFTFGPAGSTFECSLDGAAYAACASPLVQSNLADGVHHLKVLASDAAGNTDQSAAERSWTVDRTPPDSAIWDGPAAGSSTTATSVRFELTSTESGSTFECSLGGAAYSACSSPFTREGLSHGEQVLLVRALDSLGNADTTPAERRWRIVEPDRPPNVVPAVAATPAPIPVTGAPAPAPPTIAAKLRFSAKPGAKSTRFGLIQVTGVPAGATVKVTCGGRRCPKKLYTIKTTKAGTVDLKPFKTTLAAGVTLTVQVTKDGMTGVVTKLTVRPRKRPLGTIQCLRPGSALPQAC